MTRTSRDHATGPARAAIASWVAAAVLTVLVGALSLGPQVEVDATSGLSDKLLHAAFYAALAGAYLGAVRGRPVAVAAGVLAYGALLEAAQASLPERSAEVLDLAANLAGVVAATGLAAILARAARAGVTARGHHRGRGPARRPAPRRGRRPGSGRPPPRPGR